MKINYFKINYFFRLDGPANLDGTGWMVHLLSDNSDLGYLNPEGDIEKADQPGGLGAFVYERYFDALAGARAALSRLNNV